MNTGREGGDPPKEASTIKIVLLFVAAAVVLYVGYFVVAIIASLAIAYVLGPVLIAFVALATLGILWDFVRGR